MLHFALVCLAKVYEYSVLTNVMKDPLLTVRVTLREVFNKNLNS